MLSVRSGSVRSLAQTRTYSANLAGANRLCVRQSLPNQQLVNALADRLHHQHSFRKLASFDGSRTIGKAFAKWTKTTSQSVKK